MRAPHLIATASTDSLATRHTEKQHKGQSIRATLAAAPIGAFQTVGAAGVGAPGDHTAGSGPN
jgi:hypothetical protein